MEKRMKYRLKVLRSLYPYSYGVRRYWMLLLVVSIIVIGLEFVTPVFYRFFIDDVILKADFTKIYTVIVGYLLIYFVGVCVGYLRNWSKYTLVNTVLYRVRQKIMNNFFLVQFSDYEHSSIGDMKMRIDDDSNQVLEFAGSQTIDYFIACITIAASVITLFHMNWMLAVFSVVSVPFTFWLDNLLSKHEKNVSEKLRENGERRASWMHDSIQGWREVKALNLAKHETRRYYHFLHKDMLGFAKWINFWTARVLVIPKIRDECFMQFGLYFIGGLLIMAGKLKISDLLVFAVYYSLFSGAIKKISAFDAELQARMPYTDRLIESLKSPVYTQEDKKIPDESQTIVFRNVSYSYPGTEKKVIENFNLTIEKGERIAITGKSGSGKTTLLKLLTGMLTPTGGGIAFSGVDLQNIDIPSMHSRMGFVMQENILFHTTIRENLLYGKENATEEELLVACKKACIYEFIIGLPKGLDTIIGEKGIKLSGGQRQRIVLARMFLQDIDIFIFDEATSALDQYSESIIQDALSNISREKTMIVVAHRESSIKVCDRVVKIG